MVVGVIESACLCVMYAYGRLLGVRSRMLVAPLSPTHSYVSVQFILSPVLPTLNHVKLICWLIHFVM